MVSILGDLWNTQTQTSSQIIDLNLNTRNQLQNYRESFNEKSDMTDYRFTGIIRFIRDNFKRLLRSDFGKGADFKYKIMEYKGEYCYIPTDGNCFIKCVIEIIRRYLNTLTLKRYNMIL